MTYKVSICTDYDYIKSVLCEPEMWDRCCDDQTTVNVEDIPCIWLVCKKYGHRKGLCSVFNSAGCSLEIHINIPSENRGKGTIQMGKAFLAWVKKENRIGKQKINTQIPTIYKDVIQYALRLGFQKEGVNRQSVIKGSKMIDKIYMGITFQEIQA